MAITIHPLDEEDIPDFVNVFWDAFRSHPRIPMLYPNGFAPDLIAWLEKGKREEFASPQSRLLKAVDDETGQIVGAVFYVMALDPEKNAERQPPCADEPPPSDWPKGANWEMKRFFAISSHYLPVDSFAGRGYIAVELLIVRPAYHHQGIGASLLEHAVQESERHGVPLGLESTPSGLALYKRVGFKEVKTIKADMRDFGWEKPYDSEAAKRVWMVREPIARTA